MRMPPINALRAFEAAARHCSFARAGEELNVSPGAVSRFVKLLEEDLGVLLFERRPNGLKLTANGQQLRPKLTKAFGQIEDAVTQAAMKSDEVKLLFPETLGLRLLLKEVSDFNKVGKGPKLRCSIEFKGWDSFFNGEFDIGVCCFMGPKQRPEEFQFEHLRSEVLTPLCCPDLLDSGPPLKTLSDLKNFELLHSTQDHSDWRKWLAAAGVTDLDSDSGQTFMSMEFAVRAAVDGLGIVLADISLFEDEIARGELIAPFDFTLEEGTGYFMFFKPDRVKDPRVAAVREWLRDVAGQSAGPKSGPKRKVRV